MGKAKDSCRQSGCPVAYGLDVFGDKWSLLIVRDMALLGKRHYGEFLESPERIASNILADRLKRLEEAGILSKETDPENQSKSIYELTKRGMDLIPLILETVLWGARHNPQTTAPAGFVRRIRRDREGTAKEIIATLRKKESFFKLNNWI